MKKLFLVLLAALTASQAFAASGLPTPAEVRSLLNNGGVEGARRAQLGSQIVDHKIQVLRCSYNFATQGGAVGSVNLKSAVDSKDCVLPAGAIIKQVLIDVITAGTTSASGTMALTAQSAGDLKAALAAASYTGLVAGIPVGTAATMIKLTAARTLIGTIATGALTAGKWYVIVEYYISSAT